MLKKIQNKQGFTFLEVIVAVFIFSIIMLAVANIFSSSASGYKKAKAAQKNIEAAQAVVNFMVKSLRTSSVVKCGGADCLAGGMYTSIRIFDYSQTKCYDFKFEDKKLKLGTISETDKDGCMGYGGSISHIGLLEADSAYFTVIPSSSGIVGKATISMEVCGNGTGNCAANPKDKVNIQSTVSLRDYEVSGVEF